MKRINIDNVFIINPGDHKVVNKYCQYLMKKKIYCSHKLKMKDKYGDIVAQSLNTTHILDKIFLY